MNREIKIEASLEFFWNTNHCCWFFFKLIIWKDIPGPNSRLIDFSAQSFSVLFSLQLKTDSEKRSATDEPWESTEELKKPEEDFDSHGDGGGKWKGVSSGLPEDPEKTGQKASLAVSQTGSWRRGMSAQGGAPSRQKTGTSALKTPGRLVFWQLLSWTVSIWSFLSLIAAFHNYIKNIIIYIDIIILHINTSSV